MLFLLLLFNWSLYAQLEASAQCAQREFQGADKNIVCVCNSTYCDEFPRVESIESGHAVIITSSLNGKRFQRTNVQFSKKAETANFTISLDARQTFQEIIGFGGAFTDAAGVNIASLSRKAQEKLLESYFSSTGLEYSTGRVPIASTDFSFREYSYDDILGDFKLSRFKLAKEDVQFKIPYILAALNLTGQTMRLFASPWSAPGSISSRIVDG